MNNYKSGRILFVFMSVMILVSRVATIFCMQPTQRQDSDEEKARAKEAKQGKELSVKQVFDFGALLTNDELVESIMESLGECERLVLALGVAPGKEVGLNEKIKNVKNCIKHLRGRRGSIDGLDEIIVRYGDLVKDYKKLFTE